MESREGRLDGLFEWADNAADVTRQALNRVDQMLFAASEEAAEDGPELLDILASLGDRWDEYLLAHTALADAINRIYRETLQ